MAKESGVKVLLKVGDGDPGGTGETFTTLAGQQTTEMTGSTEVADTTDKADDGWGSNLNVARRIQVSASGVAVWPDTAALDVLRQTWQTAGGTVNCELILNANGDMYVGPFTVTAFNISGAYNGATQYQITLDNAGTMTYTAGT